MGSVAWLSRQPELLAGTGQAFLEPPSTSSRLLTQGGNSQRAPSGGIGPANCDEHPCGRADSHRGSTTGDSGGQLTERDRRRNTVERSTGVSETQGKSMHRRGSG